MSQRHSIESIYRRFPTEQHCLALVEQVRWRGNPTCPYCSSRRVTRIKGDWRLHCNGCNTTFSVTVNTILHRTRLDLQKWFLAIELMLSAKRSPSARQLAQQIAVHRNTAWYLAVRIRRALANGSERQLLQAISEMNEAIATPTGAPAARLSVGSGGGK